MKREIMKKAAIILAVLSCLLLAGAAQAWDCSGVTLHPGMWKWHVCDECGEPAQKQRSYVGYHFVDKWAYNLGPGQYMVILVFADGMLVRIDRGGYGF